MGSKLGRQPRWRAIGGGWIGGAAAVAACLLIVVPTTAGASPSGYRVIYKAPYKGTLTTPANGIIEVAGCAKESGKAATFSAATGMGHWVGAARASSCGGTIGKSVQQSISLIQEAVEVAVPIRVPLGPANNLSINVTWNITASGSYTLKYSGVCPIATSTGGFTYSDCYAEAITQVIFDAWLVDLTTGQIVYPISFPGYSLYAYHYVENYSYCYNATTCYSYNYTAMTPSSTFSGSAIESFVINATTNSAHKYAVVTYVGGDIVEEMATYKGVATGAINMGTLGNGYNLVNIVVT